VTGGAEWQAASSERRATVSADARRGQRSMAGKLTWDIGTGNLLDTISSGSVSGASRDRPEDL
jgi:hypothetical protein